MPLSDSFEDRFDREIDRAERAYNDRMSGRRNISDPLSYFANAYPDLEKEAKEQKAAALAYFGKLLFFFVREYSSEPTKKLLLRVNSAAYEFRNEILETKWPKPFPHPDWKETINKQFDEEIGQWLEKRREWREYEARVLPQISVPTDYAGDPLESGPLHYFRHWRLAGISSRGLTRLKAELLKVHGAFVEKAIPEFTECWRRAYDAFATEFQTARLLSSEVIEFDIPQMVADASASAGWFDEGWSRVRPTALFSERMGGRFYLPWRADDFFDALTGRVSHWRGQLLLVSCEPDQGKSGVQPLSVAAGTRWEDVDMEVADASITIRVCGIEKQMDFEAAGFGERDQRLEVLRIFAAGHGKVERDHLQKCLRGKTPLKNRVTHLRTHLQDLLRIDGDPIPYKKQAEIYVCRFKIRLAGAGTFPTPDGASWLDFHFTERRDGRLTIVVNTKQSFQAHAHKRGSNERVTEVSERMEPVSRTFSLEEIGLRKRRGLSPEGLVLTELLRGGGKLERAGGDLAVLQLGKWLREWTGLVDEPLRFSDGNRRWTAHFECSSELRA